MGLSKFLSCFGCGSAAKSETDATRQRSVEASSKPSPRNEKPLTTSSAPLKTSTGPKPARRTPSRHGTPTLAISTNGREDAAPSLSRGSSFARLSLPLEYVKPETGSKEDSEISDDILGRKSSYTVISSVDQSEVEALERNAGQLLGSPPALQGIPVAEQAISSGADAIAGAVASVGAVLHVSSSSRSLSAGGSAPNSPLTISVQTAPPTPSRPKFEIGSPAAQSSPSSSSESFNSASSTSELDSQTDQDNISTQILQSESLLGPVPPELIGRKCLVLDLDETLVHSSFKYIPDADFLIPVDIDGRVHNVFVCKRPGVDEFLKRVGELFEVVVFTASVSKYGDPLLNYLDTNNVIHHRLFRESCYNYNGNYIKNLSMLGRPLNDVIIIDNSPASYALQPQHAVPISTWFSDIHDNELLDILPLLSDLTTKNVQDVSKVLDIEIH